MLARLAEKPYMHAILYILPQRHSFKIFSVKTCFCVCNLSAVPDKHPDVLQIIQVLDVIIKVDSIFYCKRIFLRVCRNDTFE